MAGETNRVPPRSELKSDEENNHKDVHSELREAWRWGNAFQIPGLGLPLLPATLDSPQDRQEGEPGFGHVELEVEYAGPDHPFSLLLENRNISPKGVFLKGTHNGHPSFFSLEYGFEDQYRPLVFKSVSFILSWEGRVGPGPRLRQIHLISGLCGNFVRFSISQQ